MRRNTIWIALLLIVAFFALWFIFKAGYTLFSYYRLSVQVPVRIENWEVKEKQSDQFAVIAHFYFEYLGKTFQGESEVGGLYPNPWAANRAQKQFSDQHFSAWINPKNPQQALLEKKFPYKKVISAALLIGLLLYFFILGSYVRMRYGK
jgi:hypothetical protein